MACVELVLWSMHSQRWCLGAMALWGDFQGQWGMWYDVQQEDSVFGGPSMEDVKHSCIQVDVNFIRIGRIDSGSSVECSHMKQILVQSHFVLFCVAYKMIIVIIFILALWLNCLNKYSINLKLHFQNHRFWLFYSTYSSSLSKSGTYIVSAQLLAFHFRDSSVCYASSSQCSFQPLASSRNEKCAPHTQMFLPFANL